MVRGRLHLISLNALSRGPCIIRFVCKLHVPLITKANAMAGHQQDESASATTTKGDCEIATLQSKQAQRMQDMLEDDDVREALRLLHAGRPVDRPKRDEKA